MHKSSGVNGRLTFRQTSGGRDVSLDLKSYLHKFPEVCRQKFGRSYDFATLEKRFAPLREGQRWLAAKDVVNIFHPDNT